MNYYRKRLQEEESVKYSKNVQNTLDQINDMLERRKYPKSKKKEFKKENLYTCLNKEDAPIGASGYFKDNLMELKMAVEMDNRFTEKLKEVVDGLHPFKPEQGFTKQFFYLVEEE